VNESQRADDLLCDRILFGLDDAEERELRELVEPLGVESLPLARELEEVAAAIALAELSVESMPRGLAEKILAAAPSVTPAPARSVARPRGREAIGWIAAAAAAAIAIAGWWPRLRGPAEAPEPDPKSIATVEIPTPKAPTLSEERDALLATAPDAKTIAWQATKDPGAEGASGDVVWSTSAQRGYMRFRGLRRNDPTKIQYQLWIFDKERDDKYPVDGGVFDVDGDEVVVPITPKIVAKAPTLFAITIEPPGGVVVSKREHIVLTAAAGS
jgi:hypothetical protein